MMPSKLDVHLQKKEIWSTPLIWTKAIQNGPETILKIWYLEINKGKHKACFFFIQSYQWNNTVCSSMWVWLLLHLRFIPEEPEIMDSPHWLVPPIFMEVPICLFTKLEGIGLFKDFGIYGWKCYNIHVQCFKWLWGFYLFIFFLEQYLEERFLGFTK